jgi:tRNA pseudouridine55 synthase
VRAGFLVIDKPPGITSHDVVAMARATTGVEKVGHTGTLDPFATGVLPLALGPATRLIQYLDEDLKVYEATIALGAATDTGDPTGQIIRESPVPELTVEQVEAALATFKGIRMQAPPRHSAVKVRGRPLYAYARAGEDVTAAARPIRIDSVRLESMAERELVVRITCGRGTYARVLADEIAVALGTTGHLSALRRAQSGIFTLDGALDLPGLSRIVAERDDWPAVLRPSRGAERVAWRPRDTVRAELAGWMVSPELALSHIPAVELHADEARRMQTGGPPPPPPRDLPVGGRYRLQFQGLLIALATREAGQVRIDVRMGGL